MSIICVGRHIHNEWSFPVLDGEYIPACFGVGIREGAWCLGSERPAAGHACHVLSSRNFPCSYLNLLHAPCVPSWLMTQVFHVCDTGGRALLESALVRHRSRMGSRHPPIPRCCPLLFARDRVAACAMSSIGRDNNNSDRPLVPLCRTADLVAARHEIPDACSWSFGQRLSARVRRRRKETVPFPPRDDTASHPTAPPRSPAMDL